MYRYLFENTMKPYFCLNPMYPMKVRIIFMLLLITCFGCKKGEGLTFESINFDKEKCAECPMVDITIPKAMGTAKLDNTINNAVSEEIISLLNFDDDTDALSIDSAVKSFQSEYKTLKEKYAEESMPWEAKIIGEVAYEDLNILTIKLDSYLFTGGAHGYSTTRFLNFDKKRNKVLKNSELFKSQDTFEKLAETKFRIQENIPPDQSINSTGFMFETDLFYLPENIGFTKEGLQLFYEQYEVASFADGPIVLTLPYADIEDYIALKTQL